MFTGIIVELGTITRISRKSSGGTLEASCPQHAKEISVGDSIAINGVCLTATSLSRTGFSADVSQETFDRSSLHDLSTGDHINIELAMSANGRFGGHIVQGHVDDVGKVTAVIQAGNSYDLEISVIRELHKYIAKKGSIAVNGISLTVSRVTADGFVTTVIPHTYQNTTLQHAIAGSLLNIEVDILAKYVERQLRPNTESNIDAGFLAKHGFHS